jgi:hypothetical protein
MERGNDGLLEGIEDELATGTPVGFIVAALLFEAAELIAVVLSRAGIF